MAGKESPIILAGEVEYIRPWMYPKQLASMFEPLDCNGKPARISIIESSTKSGKTVSAMAWLFEQALMTGKENRNYWWVAPVYPQAKIAFRRIKAGLPKWVFKANEQELTITLPNGAVIWFKSGEKPNNLYGEDVWAAVIDEASRVRNDSWIAVRSTMTAPRGPMRLIGNVKGRGSFHYPLARRAQVGEPGLSYHRITAYDAVAGGVLALEEIEEAKRLLPEHVFRELYLAEPSDDGGNPFGLKYIDAAVGPLSDEKVVSIGVDLAKSQDWTVVIGLDKFSRVAGFERWQSPWEETTDRLISLIGKTPALVDSTGV